LVALAAQKSREAVMKKWSFVALLLLGATVLGATGVAQSAQESVTLTLEPPTFAGKWNESWFGLRFARGKRLRLRILEPGTLTVSGTVDTAATLRATIRSVKHPSPPTATQTFSRGPGRYSQPLTLPKRPQPGTYRVSVLVLSSNGTTVAKKTQEVYLKPPPEGVIKERAIVSAKRNGRGVEVLHSRHTAWARFHFAIKPPKAKTVDIQWRTPNNRLICQRASGPIEDCKLSLPIPANGTIHTYLLSKVDALDRGNWYCELSVDSRIAKRAFVRLR
jgi:hypothetical protein